jgi:hypothetical protein
MQRQEVTRQATDSRGVAAAGTDTRNYDGKGHACPCDCQTLRSNNAPAGSASESIELCPACQQAKFQRPKSAGAARTVPQPGVRLPEPW